MVSECQKKRSSLMRRIYKARYIYLFLIPGLLVLIIFRYIPMSGIILSFKQYKGNLGVYGSPWIGLYHFKRLFQTPMAVKSILTTLEISLGRLVFCFPAPIILALLINEMPMKRTCRVYQTVYTFPHFLSWVIVAGIIRNVFKTNGAANMVLTGLGLDKINFLGSPDIFRSMLYITSIWKGAGYSCILYLACITSIDTQLYEAAELDGAGRFQQIWHVTLPGLRGIILIQLILSISGFMNAGFDQIFNLRNAVVANSAQIIDTYVYDITFGSMPDYGFSTAVGLFKGVVNMILLILSDRTVKLLTGQSIYGGN